MKPIIDNDERKIEKLHKEFPDVPIEVFDIEPSEEMAMQWEDMFGSEPYFDIDSEEQ